MFTRNQAETWEVGFFIALMYIKLYLVARVLGVVFTTSGVLAYLSDTFAFFFLGQSMKFIASGVAMVSLGSLFLMTCWVFLFQRKSNRILALTLSNLFLSAVLLADVIHFRFFEGFFSLTELIYASQMNDLGSSISELFHWGDVLLFLDVFLGIGLVVYYKRKEKRYYGFSDNTWYRFVLFFITLYAGYFMVSHPIIEFRDNGGKWLFERNLSSERLYNVLGLPGYHVYDAKETIKGLLVDEKLTEEREKEVLAYFDNQKRFSENNPLKGVAKGKNVIMVQLESFQDFVFQTSVGGEALTPNMNAIRSESLVYPNLYHQAYQAKTSDNEMLVENGLYPITNGSAFMTYSRNTYDSLPGMFREKGYETMANHAFKASFWNRHVMYPNIGYDHFNSADDFSDGEQVGWGLGDKSFLVESVQKMADMKQPFFSYNITLTSHHPYTMPAHLKTLDTSAIKKPVVADYLHAVHYVDEAVGLFVEELKKQGLWENSIVVFWGDHDAGIFKSVSDYQDVYPLKNDYEAFIETRNIPFFIHFPNGEHSGVNTKVAAHSGIGETVLELAGIEDDAIRLGESLLKKNPSFVPLRDGSYIAKDTAYNASGVGLCYDRKTGNVIDKYSCLQVQKKASTILQLSDDILATDWIKKTTTPEE